MDKKYQEAAKRLAKQPPRAKQVDPLVGICAQKLQLIKKRKIICKVPSQKQKETKSNGIKKIHRQKKRENKQSGDVWLKYLPKKEDEFGQVQHITQSQKMALTGNDAKKPNECQNQRPTVSMEQSKIQEKQDNKNIENLDIEALKLKLGIGIKQENKIKRQLKNEATNQPTSLLPFPGRPFEQAPPQPPPKKIHEYPPPCKIAAIYQWPPPKSEYRLFKMQMRESRKLT